MRVLLLFCACYNCFSKFVYQFFSNNKQIGISLSGIHIQPVVSVSNLYKKFGEVQALDGLSFTVQKGDVYGFLGQNGSGKSTSIRAMLGLVKPDSGHIEIFGKDFFKHRNEVLKNTGAIIERPDLYKYLSAYDNLSIFARLSGMHTKRSFLMEQLDKVGLSARAKSKTNTFSQGMKQRLGIAIALVHDPALIILDEPSNGLDPQGITDIRNLILSLKKDQGKTVIVSSHLLSEIEIIANRMLVIDKGKKIVEGAVADLLNPDKSLFELQTADNKRALDFIRNSSWEKFIDVNHTGIYLRMHKKEMPLLIEALVQNGIAIFSVEQKQSLEDYFLSLTNQPAHVEPA